MNVLSVVSEVYPLIKTGGLADVAGALPAALAEFDIQSLTVIPGYRKVLAATPERTEIAMLRDLLGHDARIHLCKAGGLDLLIVDIPALFDRDGSPYQDATGAPFADNWERFAVFSLAGARIAAGEIPGIQPELLHVHDWQTALAPVYLRYRLRHVMPTVLTLHNIAFQGQYAFGIMPQLGLPPAAFSIDCLEYYGDIGYLKGGILTADAITTVSPTYAREILARPLGMGLEGVLQKRRNDLYGIVNGIDLETWSPEQDPLLPAPYGVDQLDRRGENRAALLARVGLPDLGGPLFAVLTRLAWQKGSDLIEPVAEEIFAAGGQIIVCGEGDPLIEKGLQALAARHPDKVAVVVGYNETMAHLIMGGADVLLQPSRFEPCGLTQLYAMRYGTIPLAARTGGLSETIIDANDAALARDVATGFQFYPVNAESLRHAIFMVSEVFRDGQTWQRLQRQAMTADFSWSRSAAQYAQLFEALHEHHTRINASDTPSHSRRAI
ncbi:starch synthase [Rhizobium sp. RU20A]|uniref:glycogen synthase GlgA n=1 Tax=Rhizobium sp. RU20A TaxID=1907412 RepID=UPI00095593AE|nr:glycogen synthase GlgA [Rhizobium sp. RU20A]SIR45740.1 starch synthase [Rhizobium sp. RU20A]